MSPKLPGPSETLRLNCHPTHLIHTLPLSSPLTATGQSVGNLEKTKEGLEGEENACGRLLQEESKKEGAVALHVYQAYWRAVGWGLALAILLSLLLMQGRMNPRAPHPTVALGPHHSHHLVQMATEP